MRRKYGVNVVLKFDIDKTGITFIEGHGSSSVAILVQTNYENVAIMRYCFSSWVDQAINLGYHLVVVNYSRFHDKNYFEIIHKIMNDYNLRTIIMNFEDLYFQKFDLVPSSQVESFYEQNVGVLLRLDARGLRLMKHNNDKPIQVKHNQRYAKSTVLTAVDREAVVKILNHKICTAWDLEVDETDFLKVYVMPSFLKYDNLIVKGKLDIYYLLKHSYLRIPFYISIYKMLTRRGLGAVLRKEVRKIKYWI